ncbi:MAG TPA: TAXI family TRAP transporter solute-binding subunit [Geminicoccaceae bacterium]
MARIPDLTIGRRRMLGGLGVLAAGAAGLPFARLTPAEAQQLLQWGSSSLGSTGYVIIEALAWAANQFSETRNSSMSTAGGAENMALLQQGLLDFAQTTSSDWQPATAGEEPYPEPVEVYQMFAYTLWNLTPMVAADSDIETLEDLKGRRVMPATAGGATAAMWQTVFEVAGLAEEVDWTYGSWTESYNAMKSGAADCIPTLLTNGRPAPVLEELQTSMDLRVLPVPDDLIAEAQERNPGILKATLTPKDWAELQEPVTTLSISGILGVHPRIDEETAYAITQAVFDHVEEVRSKGVQLQDVALEFATQHLMPQYPVHPGAARYFKEKGVWRDDLQIAELG